MPKGYRDYYIEYTAITRHALQTSATSPKGALEQAAQFATEGSCSGMQVADSSRPVLIHDPFSSYSGNFSINEGGPFMYAGNIFSEPDPDGPDGADPKRWMRELGKRLIGDADAARVAKPDEKLPCPSRMFDVRISQGKKIYRCHDCGRVARTTRQHDKPWKNTAGHDKTMASAWSLGTRPSQTESWWPRGRD